MSRGKHASGGGRAEAAFRALLLLLPAAFRERHGPAMRATFRARLERAKGRRAKLGLLLGEGIDLAQTGLRLRLAGTAGAWAEDVRHALRSDPDGSR